MSDERLRKQISYWLDGSLSEDEMHALEQRLLASADDRQAYLIAARFHAEFSNQAKSQELLDDIHTAEPVRPQPPSPPPISAAWPTSWGGVALATAACLMLSVGWWWTGAGGRLMTNRDPGATHGLPELTKVSLLTSVDPRSTDCRWYVEERSHERASAFQPGDVFRVTAGALSLQYANGTNVVLHSPAAYELVSGSQAKMLVGRLTASVTEAGKGFTVVTPQANVVDLGTEFGVEVGNDGATDVVVFKGEVDLAYRSQTAEARRLRMGEALRLDAGGTAHRIVSIHGKSYSGDSSGKHTRPLLISEVRDNIERDDSMLNYYEIVHEGMREDALSHVDRVAHQYNGVTKDGMPGYLVGADYVKMFNNDKLRSDMHIDVTLSQPARLYVFFDNRLAPPEWLTKEFQDSGDDIGLDNGPFQSNGPAWHNKGPVGVGPGESIDDELSIWFKDVEAPGKVRLGPMGVPATVGSNMYGIAASPLDAVR
ncbi:FecR protein [Posidoniimonas corsicana]|uniref:FecR protein n=1 Tax=Posidoniimonas corsicana TaxID=1938618 RepID=A0A5C5VBI8_9BACT|nr:FecR family protein [Posidoniimonas corsicana]TWT35380.1 FecR protein [Posidoniimonas corsicana]